MSRCLVAFVTMWAVTMWALILVFAAPATATTMTLGSSGWDVTWDDSFDANQDHGQLVDVIVNSEDANSVHITKQAEFIQGPNPLGVFPTIPILFTQTDADAVSQIVIDDEVITNSTGVHWADFHFLLAGGSIGGDVRATFDALGQDGFDTSPFIHQDLGDTTFDMWGGLVPNGAQWFPGSGANGGELVISVDTGDGDATPLVNFTLKETPSVPEPASCVLVYAGLVLFALVGRRRR